MADATPVKTNSRTVGRGAHWIEWLTGGICTLLVAAMIGWISYHAVVSSGGVPQLSVQVLRQQPAPDGGYEVSFIIENKGSRTAASVPVKGDVTDGNTLIETQEITFDYVPAQSAATGTLLFRTDPAAHEFNIRASGYTDP
ncbi:TIGR02588 family protein [Pararhizobium sp. DWP3-4]|uniref:TIGR02588 family protein n=1 Tax=Pararhizobium sp. DWP3-4 TaxID=2804565 RepID=UPI003CF4C1BD